MIEQMDAVESERLGSSGIQLTRGRKEIDTGNVLGFADLLHGLCVEQQVLIVGRPVWQIRTLQVFVGQRGKEHESRRRLTVVFLVAHPIDCFGKVSAKGLQAGRPTQGFVVAEERKDHARLGLGQPLVGIAEIFLALAEFQLVAGESEVANCKVQIRMESVEVGLQPCRVLHAVGEGVADKGNPITTAQLQQRFGTLHRPRQQTSEHQGQCQHPRSTSYHLSAFTFLWWSKGNKTTDKTLGYTQL